MSALYVALGACVGAPTRWWVDQLVQRRWTPVFPWGTFTVNAVGSFILGAFMAQATDNDALVLFVGIGFCGSLTTFSSFAWESLRLVDDGADLIAVLNVVGSLVVCLIAASAGFWLLG